MNAIKYRPCLKRHFFLTAIVLFATVAQAQQRDKSGGISADMLRQMEQAEAAQPSSRAIFNAIASNKIDDLARNFANQGPIDTRFSIETPAQSIHNQKSSGRCWMFSGLNVLRSGFAKMHDDTLAVEFSHDYLFFYDQLEKANLMLQGVVDHADKPIDDPRVQFFFHSPLGDGGTFCGVADLAAKYGLVPMSVQPETYSAENTSRMSALLKSKLRQFGLELRRMVADKKKPAQIEKRKTEQLATIYHMLCLTLGEPVKTFTYVHRDKNGTPKGEPKTYTPQQFYEETVAGLPLLKGGAGQGYIMVMNDPRRPYHKTYEVEYDRHTYDGTNWKYLNLPMDEIAALAIASLSDGTKLYSSYDVGKQLDRTRGYCDLENFDYASLLATDFPMDKADRISTFDSGSTHAMTLTAVDLDADGQPTRWKVENSWGADSGQKGYVVMTNRWFNEYMFRLVVDARYVPQQLVQEYQQKPLMVMPEDPLFQMDE